MEKIPIEYECFLNSSGYSQAAQDVIRALDHSGRFDIRITCFNGKPLKSAFSQQSYEFFLNLTKKQPVANAIQVYHCIPDMHRRIRRLKHSIAFATYETFDPPKHWIALLNQMDAVICPSQFNYSIFAHAGIEKPLFYLPHVVDFAKWNDAVTVSKSTEKFTFLFVGTWKRRKGWPQMLEAWFQEFEAKDNVVLFIHTDKAKTAEREASIIRRNLGLEKKDCAPIIYNDKIVDDESLPSYFRSADCLIAPSLGEGFGQAPPQCMAMKIPVISTYCSGTTDYVKEDTCTVINPSGYVVHECMDRIPQFKERKWPRITVQSVRDALRHVIKNKEEVKIKAENAYNLVKDNFSSNIVVDKFLEILETVNCDSFVAQAK